MKKLIAILAVIFLVAGVPTAYAGGWYSKSSNNNYEQERRDPSGVGADVLLHETTNFDYVAEYKYDTANSENSIFAVVKTKKSLVEYARDLIKGVSQGE